LQNPIHPNNSVIPPPPTYPPPPPPPDSPPPNDLDDDLYSLIAEGRGVLRKNITKSDKQKKRMELFQRLKIKGGGRKEEDLLDDL
jgi:hypothetical protein